MIQDEQVIVYKSHDIVVSLERNNTFYVHPLELIVITRDGKIIEVTDRDGTKVPTGLKDIIHTSKVPLRVFKSCKMTAKTIKNGPQMAIESIDETAVRELPETVSEDSCETKKDGQKTITKIKNEAKINKRIKKRKENDEL